MTRLLLCTRELAAVPYFIEAAAWNVYSLEEVCYFLKENIDLIDQSFMCTELIDWIEFELKEQRLADELRKAMHREKNFLRYIQLLLESTDYLSRSEVAQTLKMLREFENKSVLECRKLRADRMLAAGNFRNSLEEYRRVIAMEEVDKQEESLMGDVLHNMGVAYSGMFFWPEAIACYEKAYEYNHNLESLKELEFVRYFMNRNEKLSADNQEILAQIKTQNIHEIQGKTREEKQQMLDGFKQEYIRNCTVKKQDKEIALH